MPLIMMAGLPTSGKTTRAKQLFDYFADRIGAAPQTAASPSFSGEKQQQQQQQVQQQCSQPRYRLHLISDDTLSIPRSVYDLSPGQVAAHTRSANSSEKDARAAVYAAVKRVLSDRDIVILDGLNYIKGWRYQLFCEAKAARTPSAVLQIGCPVDKARAINERRLEAALGGGGEAGQERAERGGGGVADEWYGRDNWENLVFRYEEPSGMSRWDSPLFVLTWDDDEAAARATFARLWDAVAGEAKPVVRPNSVTVQRARDVGGDYLYLLERETQEVVRRVLEGVEGGGGAGGAVAIPRGGGGGDGGGGAAATAATAATPRGRRSRGEPPEEGGEEEEVGLVVEVPAGRAVGLPQLQRLRRTFVALNRGGIGLERVGSLSVDRVRESFVRYLNDHFEGGE